MPEITRKLTIGSDPEFGFISRDGVQYPAHRINILSKYAGTKDGVGLDGHRDLAEIRTGKGATNPIRHVQQIERRLKQLFVNLRNMHLEPRAGSLIGSDSIGGHIHFGLNRNLFNKSWIDTIDLCVAVPSLMIEDIRTAKTRRQGNYGHLGDFRTPSWGIEYRTLPSWLVSKGFATSMLSLGYVVMDNLYVARAPMPKFSDLKAGSGDYFIHCERKYFAPLIPRIYGEIKKCRLYPKYSQQISALFGFIKAFNINKQKGIVYKDWNEGTSMLPRWRLTQSNIAPSYFWQISVSSDRLMGRFKTALMDKYWSTIPIRLFGISKTRADNIGADISIYPDAFYNYLIKHFQQSRYAFRFGRPDARAMNIKHNYIHIGISSCIRPPSTTVLNQILNMINAFLYPKTNHTPPNIIVWQIPSDKEDEKILHCTLDNDISLLPSSTFNFIFKNTLRYYSPMTPYQPVSCPPSPWQ